LREYFEKNFIKKLIRKFISPTGISIFFIFKKNDKLRLYIDYRALNKFIIKNRYSLLLIGEIINRFGEAKIYTKLNLRNTYYRIRIKNNDE
jgi:hypothetical protein